MKYLFYTLALFVALTTFFHVAPLTAQTLNLATGKAGGGYDAYTQNLATRLTQRGIETAVANYNGSDEISLAVCNNKADAGPMQIDAIYARALEGCTLQPVAVYGTEQAFILFPPGSNKSSLSDLTEADTVLVDTVGSGSDLFWATIKRIETGDDGDGDSWASAKSMNDTLNVAHAAANMGNIQAVILVRKTDSADLGRLLNLEWQLGELWDRDIDDLKFNNRPLYESAKTTISFNGSDFRNYTYAVRSLVAANAQTPTTKKTAYNELMAIAQ